MVRVDDLEGRPYEPELCLGYVRIALARIFQDFRPSDLPASREEVVAWLEAPPEGRWLEVGPTAHHATREGDVLFGGGPSGDYVAVLVDEKGGGFLTATPERGCHVRPRRSFQGVRTVGRLVRCETR
jgi:hypothetical protein